MCDFSKAWRENRNVIMENRANLLKSLGESLRNTAYFEITRNLHFYHGIRQKISVTLLEWYFNFRRQTIWKEKSCSIRNRSYYKRINQRKEKSVSTKQTSCWCKSLTTWAQHRVSLLIKPSPKGPSRSFPVLLFCKFIAFEKGNSSSFGCCCNWIR